MAYALFVCPNAGCGREESAGKAPFYSSCPRCLLPCGRYLPKPMPEPEA